MQRKRLRPTKPCVNCLKESCTIKARGGRVAAQREAGAGGGARTRVAAKSFPASSQTIITARLLIVVAGWRKRSRVAIFAPAPRLRRESIERCGRIHDREGVAGAEKWDEAVAAFARTREAAAEKSSYTLGLAPSSFGWEALRTRGERRFADAAKYYSTNLHPVIAALVISLRDVMRKMFVENSGHEGLCPRSYSVIASRRRARCAA
jgi:hypothetical protein